MAIVDADLRVKSASHLFAQQFGTTAEALRRRGLCELVRQVDAVGELQKVARGEGDLPTLPTVADLTLTDEGKRAVHKSARAFRACDGVASRVLLLTAAAVGRRPRQK